jgi:predicted DNA-binding transcriptional regulator YafY
MLASTVREMVAVGKVYLMVYSDASGEITERLVTVEFANGTLFAGTCHLRNARRCFCYDRVLAITEWTQPVAAWKRKTFGPAPFESPAALAWVPILAMPNLEMAYA